MNPVTRLLTAPVLAAALSLTLPARADTYGYWGPAGTDTSPVTGNWNLDNNWSDSLAPASSADNILTFGGSGSTGYTATDNISGAFLLNQFVFNSTSTGTVTLSGGTLNFVNDSSSDAPQILQNGSGPVSIGSALTLTNLLTIGGSGTGSLALTGVLSGSGGLTLAGSGTTTLSASNTMTGPVTLTSGTLVATASVSALGTGAATLTLAGGTLQLTNSSGLSFARATTVTGDTTIITDRTTAGGGLTHTLGTLSIGGGKTLTVAGGANVTGGTAGLTFNGATTLTGDAFLNVTAPSGGGVTLLTLSSTLNLGANTLTVEGSGNTTLSGIISGTTGNALTKTGSGTLILSALNTFTGLTTVSGGTLSLNRPSGSGAILVGDVLVTGSGTLTASSGADQFGTAPTTNVTLSNGGFWNLGTGSGSQSVKTLAIGTNSDTAQSEAQTYTTLKITGSGANVLNLQGSVASPAILSLGGYGQTVGTINLTNATPGTTTTVNFGANSQILSGGLPVGSANGAIYSNLTTSASNYVSFNFNGTTISTPSYDPDAASGTPGSLYYNQVRVGDVTSQTAGYFDQVNLNASLGDGTGWLEVVKSQINLGWTGSIDLGALISARDGSLGNSAGNNTPSTASNPITVLATATGMTGGQIYGAGNLVNGPGTAATFTSLLFQNAGTAHTFTLGTDTAGTQLANTTAVIDVRTRDVYTTTSPNAGQITQNNISLDLSGGALRGNSLVDSTGAGNSTITIENGGELALSVDTGTYTISTTAVGANNRTIYMKGSGAGTFSLGGSGTSAISIALQSGTGGWSGGTINANSGHTITDGTGGLSTTSTAGFINGYTIAANSGLNGLVMANASPFATSAAGGAPAVSLTLGTNASFFAKDATAASTTAVTYYIGTSGTLAALTGSSAPATLANTGIAVASGGNFMVGLNQTNSTATSLNTTLAYTAGAATATITLPGTTTPGALGLSVGGSITIGNTSGTNANYYNGTFIITGISGNVVTFDLNLIPPSTALPGSTSTSITRNETLVLLRDKGSDNLSLLANTAGGVAHIATSQTGSGNLYINAGAISLDAGTTFTGTGGIYSGNTLPGSGWTNYAGSTLGTGNTGSYGTVNGSSATSTLFTVNGALGTSSSDNITVNLSGSINGGSNGSNSSIILGSTASLAGTQTWSLFGSNYNNWTLFANNITTPSSWNATIDLIINGGVGTFEASTNTTAPATSANSLPSSPANYRFDSLTFTPTSNSTSGFWKLVNNVTNDGAGTGNEAFYAGSFSSSASDSSGGTFLFDLNGQDLFLDQFTPASTTTNNFTNRGFLLMNDAADSVSVVKLLGNTATVQPFQVGGFRVLNGSTIQIQGGNWYDMITSRSGGLPADTAAAPNVGTYSGTNTTLSLLFTGIAGSVPSSGTSFLGSGTDTGGNSNTTYTGTNGTFQVIGGNFQNSGYIINPVGTTGEIDAFASDGVTLNNVTIRANAAQSVTAVNNSSWFTLGTQQLYSVGDVVQFSAAANTTGLNTGLYYVVGVNGLQVQVSSTPGGAAITSTGTFTTGMIQDPNGAANSTVFPALVVAGTTTIQGNLILSNSPGAANQATLRVGGVVAGTGTLQSSTVSANTTILSGGSNYTNGATVTVNYTTGGTGGTVTGTITGTTTSGSTVGIITGIALDTTSITGPGINSSTTFGTITAAAGSGVTLAGVFSGATTTGTALLNVTGDLTVGATNNLAIQSNGTVNVGGNVSIAGVGINVADNVTGTGVGFNAASHFTLNGNKGLLAPQTVSIVPALGNFHVGDGSGGTLTGTAAQARLAANLSVITSADINGAASSLNLGGFRLTAGGSGLTVGGILAGTGAITGNVAFTATGTASFNLNGIATAGTDYDQIAVTGAIVQNGILQLNIGSSLATLLSGAADQTTTLALFTGATPSGSFTSIALTGTDTNSATGNTLVGNSTGITYTYDNTSGMLTLVGASPIPEPATSAALAAAALLAFAAVRRRISSRIKR